MNRHYRWFIIITILTAFAVWVSLPSTDGFVLDLNGDTEAEFAVNSQSLGLDLVGGLRVLLQADLPADQFSREDLQETANSVSRRINALGLAEATIQLQGNSRVLVELPGVSDPQQAISTIQETALLEFVDFAGLSSGQVNTLVGERILTTEQEAIYQARLANAENPDVVQADLPTNVDPNTGRPFPTVLTGGGLQAAAAQFDPNTGEWFIQFELTSDGGSVFGPFTASRIGSPLAIVLDSEVLSAPVIQAQLDTGGIIEGNFTEEEARTLALQLRTGALRIPLSVESAVTVGATLGQESVDLSLRAGIIGVFVVFAFMILYYRVPGISAALALAVFIALNLAIFKLLPVTLTLPAITGFLISIGTAVDGNILIFERVKEELREGKNLNAALDSGFDRAWASIRDSNISTIIICAVLFFFGQTPGASIVSGFAITLALGLMLNLFTAVTVTRTFLYIFDHLIHQQLMARRWLLGA